MTANQNNGTDSLYRWAVWLLIVTSVATMVGRIAAVRSTTGETPMLSANDRSRWCTVRTLVEDGSYVIDRLVSLRHPETGRRVWKSIDMVRHRGPDGKEHYYSSKPTLLPTLLAGQYWVIHNASGATLGEQPFLVMRIMLVLTNVLPLLIYFIVLWRLIDRLTSNRMAAFYTMAAATWGTFLTTFSVTINNHIVAAIAVLLAAVLMLHVWFGERGWWYFAGAGLCSAFAVANELPALSFFACVALAALSKSPRQTILFFVPAALLVTAGFFGTNQIAHGTMVPAYMHRSDGEVVATVPTDLGEELDAALAKQQDEELAEKMAEELAAGLDPELATERESELRPKLKCELDVAIVPAIGVAMKDQELELSEHALMLFDQLRERWSIWDKKDHSRYALVSVGEEIEIRRWGNWYDYRGSYWQTERDGVDRGELSRGRYAFHSLLGHRGVFSLTPIWLLSVVGVVMLLREQRPGWALFGTMIIALTVVCLAFYISRPTIDRNYGGVCCGFRWMFWFTPLWLLCLAPAADWVLRSKTGRAVAVVLLMISIFSATYAAANPWSQPWLYNLGTYAGWLSY